MLFLQICLVSVVCFAHGVSSSSSMLGGESSALSALPSLKDKISSRSSGHPLQSTLSVLCATTSEFPEVIPSTVPHKTAVPLPANEIAKNFWLRMTFAWVKNLMKTGNKRPLQMYDLWTMEEKDQMLQSSAKFEELFEQEKQKQALSESTAAAAAQLAASSVKEDANGLQVKKKKKYLNIIKEFWKSPVTRAIVLM